jgi:lysozyme
MQIIIDFLNRNECLSNEWKEQLIHLIHKELEQEKTPTRIIECSFIDELKELIRIHEGKRNEAYFDSVGVKTIGYGFNMQRADMESIMQRVGAIKPYTRINDEQMENILDITVKEAIDKTKDLFYNLEEHPRNVQLVLCDMMFNLGPSRLSQFKKMIDAVNNRNYNKAADEMVDSRWYIQVGNRSKHLVNLMRMA